MADEMACLREALGFEDLQCDQDGRCQAVYSGSVHPCDGSPTAIARTVQVLRPGALDPSSWADAVARITERIERLFCAPLPFVLPILRAGKLTNGNYYLVHAKIGTPLVEFIRDNEGHPRAQQEIEGFVETLLVALAAVHKTGTAHGDLRLTSIQMQGNGGSCSSVPWITGVEWGGLAHWSTDTHFWGDDDGDGYLLPPESDGKPPQPSPRADLYALGLIICQFAGGRRAIEHATLDDKTRRIRSRPVRKLVTEYLLSEDPTDRPDDAGAALREFNRLSQRAAQSQLWRKRMPTPLGWTACLLLLACMAIVVLHVRKERAVAQRDDDIQKQNAEIIRLSVQVSQPKPSTDPASPESSVSKDKTAVQDAAARLFRQQVEQHIRRDDVSDWLEDRLKSEIPDRREKIIRQISQWSGAFTDRNTYSIRVADIETEKDWSKNWRLTVEVGGDTKILLLTPEDFNNKTISINWSKGQPIHVWLEHDGYLYYANLVDRGFSSDYAIWELNWLGQAISQNDSTLKLEVVDCPGPPRPPMPKPISSSPLVQGTAQQLDVSR